MFYLLSKREYTEENHWLIGSSPVGIVIATVNTNCREKIGLEIVGFETRQGTDTEYALLVRDYELEDISEIKKRQLK